MIEAQKPSVKKKKRRVAAYCRVSTDHSDQLESLETQKAHYESYILLHSEWEYAGLYYDTGITGTKAEIRDGLQNLLTACRIGKVEHILVKSISRFSRNTTDCLSIVRELLNIGVTIYFEKENIDTGDMESELILSILSSMAEEESASISKNEKWSIQRRMAAGTFKIGYVPYGYQRNDNGDMVIEPAEAGVVRFIFRTLLAGNSTDTIASALQQQGIPTRKGGKWSGSTVRDIIVNEKYVGDALFQKTYTDESFRRHNNHGEVKTYLVSEHHEPIISREDFEAARIFISQRASEKGVTKGTDKYQNRYAFSGKIICGECGNTFKRRIHSCTDHKYIAWCCNTHIKDKDRCHMLFVRDDALKQSFTTMLNKLIFSYRQILKPYLESLKTSSSDDSLHRIQQIQTLLAQNTEKRETLTMLMTQGIIDPVLYSQETNELLSQADSFRDEIEALKNEVSGDVNKVTETTALIHFAEKSAMLQEFDKDLFDRYVKRIIVHSRNDIRFELKCGLTLRERK